MTKEGTNLVCNLYSMKKYFKILFNTIASSKNIIQSKLL